MQTFPKSPKIFHLLFAGGTAKSKEQEISNSCECLTIKIDENDEETGNSYTVSFQSEKFAELRRPRRGASLHYLGEEGRLFILGGCELPQSHLNSAEIYDRKTKRWYEISNVLAQGRSCFAVNSTASRLNAEKLMFLECLGGWNGEECLNNAETIDMNKLRAAAALLITEYEEKMNTTQHTRKDVAEEGQCGAGGCLGKSMSVTEPTLR